MMRLALDTQGLPITGGALVLAPDEPRAWLERAARADLHGDVKLAPVVEGRTVDGWPFAIVEASTPTETRLVAGYTFLQHAALAIARGAPSMIAAQRDAILRAFERGRPDWRGEPICIADLWDLEPKAIQRRVRPTPVGDDPDRARALLEASEAAIARDPADERAHYFAGVALGTLGRHADAAAAWERALMLADRTDTRFNLGQARFLAGDHAAALAQLEVVATREPDDMATRAKICQCLYALGRESEAEAARAALRTAWNTSADPRTRIVRELVFDQFAGDGCWIHAIEPLRFAAGGVTPILMFRAMEPTGSRDRALPAAVIIETSERARAAGTPFVLVVEARGTFRVVGGAVQLPSYSGLKQEAVRMLAEALRA